MTTIEELVAESARLGGGDDGNQLVAVTTTASKLSLLHLHLEHHIRHLEHLKSDTELVFAFRAIQDDVRKAVEQVLKGREARAAEDLAAREDIKAPEKEEAVTDDPESGKAIPPDEPFEVWQKRLADN